MPTAIMANGLEQLKNAPQMPKAPETKRPVSAEQQAQVESERAEAAARSMEAQSAADRQAESIQAKLRALDASTESPAPAPAKEEKKGLFARAGGWFKGLFSPSIEDRSEAHAKAEAAKNPLVAQQMRDAESANAISKAEFKKMMAEGAVSAKAEAKRKAEQALKDQSAAIGELGIVGHNEAFGKMGEARIAAEAKATAEATKKAAAEAKASLTAGLKGKEAKIALGMAEAPKTERGALSKQAEAMLKKNDTEFMGYVADDNTPEEAANMVAQRKEAQSVVRKEKVKSAVRRVMNPALAELVDAGENADDAAAFLASARRDEAKARREKPGYATAALSGIMNGAKRAQETVKRAATGETGTGAYELGMNAVNTGIEAAKATGRGAKRAASKGAELLDRGLGAVEQAAVGNGGLVEKAVQKTGRAGELAGKAADAFLNAGPKALEKGLDAKARAEKAAGDFLAKDWEATKARMAARLESMKAKPAAKPWEGMEEPAWVSDLHKGDEDVPDEIAAAVAETAAERAQGPENFADVFDNMKDLAESDNRSRKAAFLAEAEILEGMVAKNADPNEYLGAIGDDFRGWKTRDVQKLLNRLYETNLLAK